MAQVISVPNGNEGTFAASELFRVGMGDVAMEPKIIWMSKLPVAHFADVSICSGFLFLLVTTHT